MGYLGGGGGGDCLHITHYTVYHIYPTVWRPQSMNQTLEYGLLKYEIYLKIAVWFN